MKFSVSVIIPNYNAEDFIEKAIDSALEQPEVAEVIVVDDGSTDNSVQILERIQKQENRLKIYFHPKNENRGRSATRNLGLKKCTQDFIAFLDSDDYYLQNRFRDDCKIFEDSEKTDGVYNAVGFHFYREATEDELKSYQLYTVTKKVLPEELFENLLYGKCGHFHINGLTVKKTVFDVVGFFNESLVVAEDTDIFWKMAIKCRLEAGIIDRALAIRGIHDDNIFDNKDIYRIYNIKMHESIAIWCNKNQVDIAVVDDILKWIWMLKYQQKNKLYEDIMAWAQFFFKQPQLLFSVFSIKYFPVIRYRQMLFPFLYKK